jgi:hypothetical protein
MADVNLLVNRVSSHNRILCALMALVLVACGCTDEGCGNDLRFSSRMLMDWADADEFTLELCINGDCETRHITDASSSPWLGLPLDPSLSGSIAVEVALSTSASTQSASGTIELDSYRPNGGLCAPVCRAADVVIENGTVQNAEPGEIPPRD